MDPYTADEEFEQPTRSGSGGGGGAQWQEQPQRQGPSNFRSVTPAMNNTRGAVRNGMQNASPAAAAGMRGMSPGHAARSTGGTSQMHSHYEQQRATTPGRSFDGRSGAGTPSSSGLIRLALRKPMGIVFEPMYDPNAPSVQRGVRICDLPRTGAAALSRNLEIGDELLSINDRTMSRLTFDEIMDFIIDADPDQVNLLFRRPRKETLNARNGIKTPTHGTSAAASTPAGAGVKWVDDEHRNKKKGTERKKSDKRESAGEAANAKASSSSNKKSSRKGARDDDETFVSEDADSRRYRKKGRGRKDPYESESFLDLLIDTICANPDNVCRDRRRRDDDEYYSDEDDGTFASRDDSTYVTYESEKLTKSKQKQKQKQLAKKKVKDVDTEDDDDESVYDEAEKEPRGSSRGRSTQPRSISPKKDAGRLPIPDTDVDRRDRHHRRHRGEADNYEDDGTLESVDSRDRQKPEMSEPEQEPPLGLAHTPKPESLPEPPAPVPVSDVEDDRNPAPIKELEYDDQVDADVSVMESLGGPSLLIEKQRQAIIMNQPGRVPEVPRDIIDGFGDVYPVNYGFSLEQTIQQDPLKFYTFVVKSLLEEHEPEKVRLLDKLMAKYKGREDHLVQKLSVRYNKTEGEGEDDEDEDDHQPEDPQHGGQAFEEKDHGEEEDEGHEEHENADANIETAKQRMYDGGGFPTHSWPDKETKEDDPEELMYPNHEEGSGSGSEYSGDSIDGTSPAVIAQVSELLNYVYGKTSVPGQIDRVSTIMRAYEGREAVLLELLETKALIKANREKENASNLPSFLRNSASTQRNLDEEVQGASDMPPVTPMATRGQEQGEGQEQTINDDMSSMSGVSSPAPIGAGHSIPSVLKQIPSAQSSSMSAKPHRLETKSTDIEEYAAPTPSSSMSKPSKAPTPDNKTEKKKKKGLFGGLFGKKGKKSTKKLKNEGSI